MSKKKYRQLGNLIRVIIVIFGLGLMSYFDDRITIWLQIIYIVIPAMGLLLINALVFNYIEKKDNEEKKD